MASIPCPRQGRLLLGPLALSLAPCPGPLPSRSCPCFLYRTAGTLFGEGFRAFVTDWDKVTATVNATATSSPQSVPGPPLGLVPILGGVSLQMGRAKNACGLGIALLLPPAPLS